MYLCYRFLALESQPAQIDEQSQDDDADDGNRMSKITMCLFVQLVLLSASCGHCDCYA